MKNINIQKLKQFFLSFTLFVALIMGCRLLSGEASDLSRDLGYVASFSLLFAMLTMLWNNNKKHLLLCLVFVGLYLLAALYKRYAQMILQEREITHTIGTALILFSVVSLAFYSAFHVKNGLLKVLLKIVSVVLCLLFILPPLIFLGYAAVNHGIFSSDIMLTLFQTNLEEVGAYLQDRNLWQWGAGTLVIVAVCLIYVLYWLTVKSAKFYVFGYIITLGWCIYTIVALLPKLNLCFLVNVYQTTKVTLDGFDDFKKSQDIRAERLKQLMKTHDITSDSGIYVLVIGESETKDHMGLYGYDRPTTPWLEKLVSDENTIVFTKAYSNHTHTVPTLTYALSAKNQYNETEPNNTFSIVEAAKAAGFKTYWLSNQAKYGVLETPITTIAAQADEQFWLNTNTGDKIFTTYYDEKLADYLNIDEEVDKALIIIHLMGSHGAYRDRYPARFGTFTGKGRNIDAYDNSVLYTDYVLHKIYDKMKDNPNFMVFVYFSDHGDDVDNSLGHESSRFTYPMARIPLVVNVSSDFTEKHREQIENLRANSGACWTNDLVYDMMLGLTGIKGLSDIEDKYNLLSGEYNLPCDEVKLLHGQKTIINE